MPQPAVAKPLPLCDSWPRCHHALCAVKLQRLAPLRTLIGGPDTVGFRACVLLLDYNATLPAWIHRGRVWPVVIKQNLGWFRTTHRSPLRGYFATV